MTQIVAMETDFTESSFVRCGLGLGGFIGSNMTKCSFAGSDLTAAHFARAVLALADLSGAPLEKANFAGADLSYADLSRAKPQDGGFLPREGYARALFRRRGHDAC